MTRVTRLRGPEMAFDLDAFVDACCGAVVRDKTHVGVAEIMAAAFQDPDGVMATLGTPQRGGIGTIHRAADLTILNVVWQPNMSLVPHNHNMWAVIGVYCGREDNIFWRRTPDGAGAEIEAAGAKTLLPGDVAPLGKDIIHSVTNPLPKLTGAIHVYGGDFFADGRSEWDAEALTERPFNLGVLAARFGNQ